jgi:tetratricopeptide (TPR) repeat protein
MALTDPRGHLLGTRSEAARDAVERALWRMMSFYDPPLDDLDRAIAEDPGWALPHTMVAGYLCGLTEPGMRPEAELHLRQAQHLADAAPLRERMHLEAVQRLFAGRWHEACRLWDDNLLERPRDALALQWAQLWDFHRGDAVALRGRPARALPEWDPADPLYPHVLALYAFGLEENHEYAAAEDHARQALALDARAPWAVHTVAHVMEMQGRFDDGAAWLRQHQPAWAEGNGFAGHLWWHMALFRLEGLDLPGALRLADTHLAGAALHLSVQRLDAVGLLWRLHLHGQDVAARCRELLAAWQPDLDHAGHHAFNDLHVVLAALGAGEPARAEAWAARCAERVMAADDLGRSNHAVAREVALPLMRCLLALARGEAGRAARGLYALRPQLSRLGGSHAQRDLVDQTLLAATAQAPGHDCRALGRALLNERRLAKPVTPLTRHWAERLGVVLA